MLESLINTTLKTAPQYAKRVLPVLLLGVAICDWLIREDKHAGEALPENSAH